MKPNQLSAQWRNDSKSRARDWREVVLEGSATTTTSSRLEEPDCVSTWLAQKASRCWLSGGSDTWSFNQSKAKIPAPSCAALAITRGCDGDGLFPYSMFLLRIRTRTPTAILLKSRSAQVGFTSELTSSFFLLN